MNVYPIINKEKILYNLNVRIEQFKEVQRRKIKTLILLRKFIRGCEEYDIFYPQRNEHKTIQKTLKELKDLRHSII